MIPGHTFLRPFLSSACSEQTSKYSLADFWPFFPLSRLLFPVLLWKLVRNEDQHLDDLSPVYLDSKWLTWDGDTLAPFQDLPKRPSLQTPRILRLRFSLCILRKNYSRADEFVHTILLVVSDPIAITPAVVHGILTKISFPFTLCKTQRWELLLALTAQVVWVLIKLFFCLEQNRDSMATRHEDNARRQWKTLCRISLPIGLHLVYLALKIKFIVFKHCYLQWKPD